MNKTNKIVLSLVMGLAMNQSFTSEAPKDAKSAIEILKEKELAEKDAIFQRDQAKKAVADRNEILLKNSTLTDEDRSKDTELQTLKAKEKLAELAADKATAAKHTAWNNAHTILATASKYATGIALGGFAIAKLELTGIPATLVKCGSLATVVLATAFVVAKGYEYFFEEEIDEEEAF